MHGDSQSLPWPDGSFDAVFAMHHLGHVPVDVAERVVAEAARVLAPGGRMIVVDHRWHPRVAGVARPAGGAGGAGWAHPRAGAGEAVR